MKFKFLPIWILFLLSSPAHATIKIVYESQTVQAAVLSGSWYDIGRDAARHAQLDLDRLFPMLVRSSFERGFSKATHSNFLGSMLTDELLKRYQPYILDSEKEMLAGIPEGMNVECSILERAFMSPEAQNYCLLKIDQVGSLFQSVLNSFRRVSNFISVCSSLTAPDSSGRILFGHNMDYAGVGFIDEKLGVYLIKSPEKLRILTPSPRGIPLPGKIGMNEEGLALALHITLHQDISSDNRTAPILSVNREVLENAHTVEEALSIYQKYSYMSGWLIEIADTQTSGIIELSGLGVNWIPADQSRVSALSNSFLSEMQAPREYLMATGFQILDVLSFLRSRWSLNEGDSPRGPFTSKRLLNKLLGVTPLWSLPTAVRQRL